MKKKYSKPQIAFDSFEIATSIADGCSMPAEFVQDECGLTIGGMPYFTQSINACWIWEEDKDEAYGICYYVPMADNKVFGS